MTGQVDQWCTAFLSVVAGGNTRWYLLTNSEHGTGTTDTRQAIRSLAKNDCICNGGTGRSARTVCSV